jgi:bifunctional ADP-heptose synthase (sugar kinase/adenylyltransferase)
MNLEAVKHYKVLLIGDGIYDRYVFVSALGKSIKDPIISLRHESEEIYRGGAWAAGAHLNTLCDVVDVSTSPFTMNNTRFLETVYKRKLFTVHEPQHEEKGRDYEIGDYDVVIVLDFGHGTMTKELIERVTNEAKFLAVNTQTNSQNYGFNVITKYPRADYVVLDELEARLAVHDNHSPIQNVILKLGYQKVIVTMGANGALGYDGTLFHGEAARATEIIDTTGAGDAFIACSAPFAAAGFPMQDLVRIGNAAGAVKLGILGHRRAVTKTDLEALL